VLMIFEMTQDYAVIVPLMIANLVSLFVASRLQEEPIYEALAVQDGIHLPKSDARQRGQRQIARVMHPATDGLAGEMTVREALEKAQTSDLQSWLVMDERGVIGVINRFKLEQESSVDGADKQLRELVDPLAFPHVHADQSLDLALERMGANQVEILPVVNRADVRKVEGIVTLRDVLNSYGLNRA
jgi:CIC family chloride channel protein